MIMSGPSAPRTKKEISLVDVMAFYYILSDLFFFDHVWKNIDFIERTVFERDIEPIKSAAVVRRSFVVNFFEVFGEDFAD
jgi:hypothetical protein